MSNVHLNEDEVEIPGFRITGILARGKVSTVFSAIQDVPVRPVALKLFKPTTVDDVRIKRFFQEADILLRLQHPGLARLIQTGMCHTEIGKHHFHVFEPIEGIPITQYADERNLNSRQRLELFLLVCDILSYVHQEGVLHRNLKPDNILVDRHGQPKLIDFGMARLVTGAPKLTTRGQIVGNLTFLSPEQTKGKSMDLDERMDLYAIAGIGYQLLAGRPPLIFKGNNLAEALEMVLSVVPEPLGKFNSSFAGDLERVFARALEKDKNLRHDSVAAFAADLREHLQIASFLEEK